MALTNFRIDQAATFAGVVYLSCEPKMRLGSQDQDVTKDGTPKWELQVLGGFRNRFAAKVDNEVIKIGVASMTNPAQGLSPYTPVHLVDFEVGVMEKTKRNTNGDERVVGVTVWYRASGVKSTADTGSKSAAAA